MVDNSFLFLYPGAFTVLFLFPFHFHRFSFPLIAVAFSSVKTNYLLMLFVCESEKRLIHLKGIMLGAVADVSV